MMAVRAFAPPLPAGAASRVRRSEPPHRFDPRAPLDARGVLELQRTAGNGAVAAFLQRCGPVPCDCSAEERAEYDAAHPGRTTAQREPDAGGAKCGPGTANPFCLPIPGPDEPCRPFDSLDHAMSVWADLSNKVPVGAVAATRCGEVGPVWNEYFAATSTPFAFSSPSSCVVSAALANPRGSSDAEKGASVLLDDIVANLPFTLHGVTPPPLPGLPFTPLKLPLEAAIGGAPADHLHPKIGYSGLGNAAANLVGGTGTDDDRVMSGQVVIDVRSQDPATGAFTGEVRWVPHVHVIDTVDFCPGFLGTGFARQLTVPMSKLEAMGLTADVPVTIDYDLPVHTRPFVVTPRIGPPPPPKPPGPDPKAFPRSGPAKTTGSLLRIRTGPGLTFPALGLLGAKGTPIEVSTQVRGDPVDGNDRWNRIDRGFVSDRFVGFDADVVP